MDETAARQVLLARAYDSAPPSPLWNEDDRAWVRQATARRLGEHAAIEEFVVHRAALVVERIAGREPAIGRLLQGLEWRPWIGWLVIGLALVAGLATDALAAGPRINVLAPPLLATLAWNLGVFGLLAARTVRMPRTAGSGGMPESLIERLAGRSRAARVGGAPIGRFLRDWSRTAAGLHGARIAQVLHLAAATFAVGLLAGLYLRGLVLEYRAGWESTFLGPAAVRALLGAVLGPASAITGIPLPDEARIAAIRFTAGPGENAARWMHLHAATIAMFVVLPRLALALAMRWRAHRLARAFPLRLDDAYFGGLASRLRGEAVRVPVVPYSYRLPATSIRGLHALLEVALGTEVELDLEPGASADDADAPAGEPIAGPVEAVVVLFNLGATPEVQTHADFVGLLRTRLPAGAALVAAVDETTFRARFGHEPRRLDERRAAWRGVLADAGCEPLFVALGASDVGEAAPLLRDLLERSSPRAREAGRIGPEAR